jgi:hypothetical protein
MFAFALPDAGETVVPGGNSEGMADLFAIVGLVAVGLLGVARWWEEH